MKIKPAKAWAILCPNGKLRPNPADQWLHNTPYTPWLFCSRSKAHGETLIGQKAIQVLITPIGSNHAKRK